MAKTMNKRSRRTAKKAHKRTAKKERKDKRKTYRKGSKSKTMKGKKDFTTKKTSKVFNRRRHYQKHAEGSRVKRRPYAKKGGMGRMRPVAYRYLGSQSTTGSGSNQFSGADSVNENTDGMPEITGHRIHTGSSQGQSSASTKTSSRVKSSNPVIVKTKEGAYVVDGKAGAVSGN